MDTSGKLIELKYNLNVFQQGKKVYKTTAVQCDYLRLFVIVCWHRGEAIELKGWSRTTTTSYSALLLTAADRCKNIVAKYEGTDDYCRCKVEIQLNNI